MDYAVALREQRAQIIMERAVLECGQEVRHSSQRVLGPDRSDRLGGDVRAGRLVARQRAQARPPEEHAARAGAEPPPPRRRAAAAAPLREGDHPALLRGPRLSGRVADPRDDQRAERRPADLVVRRDAAQAHGAGGDRALKAPAVDPHAPRRARHGRPDRPAAVPRPARRAVPRLPSMIAVTGATGYVGSRVAARLAEAGAPVRLVVRDPARAPQLPAAEVRAASGYGAGAEMRAALEGADTVLLIPGAESPDRVQQHKTAVDAAEAAGARRIVYLSAVGAAPDSVWSLLQEHWQTEEHIRGSGLAWTFPRFNLTPTSSRSWSTRTASSR